MPRHAVLASLAGLLLASACAGRKAASRTPGDVTPRRVVSADSVLVLQAGGDPPADTTVRIVPGRPYSVVLRHPAPDQSTFAVVEFSGTAPDAEPYDVSFHARPGTFGLDISATRPLGEATITFKYARYFVAPPEARERYRTDVRYERRLAVAREGERGTVVLLPTRRAVADNVTAPLEGPGSYFVAGLR